MSFSSLYAPRVPPLPSTQSVHPVLHYWARQVVDAVNALPAFSTFSWPTPESNVTAMPGTIGINLAPFSVTGQSIWVKETGSGNTGWV